MISINISINSKGYINKYIVEGHADFGEYGKDIVCAAVSVLAQTTLISLNKISKIKEKELDYKINEKIGYLEVSIPKDLDKERSEKAETILRTFELGIKSIIETYPKYITLKYQEV